MSNHYIETERVFSHISVMNSILGQLEWDLFVRMPRAIDSSSAERALVVQRMLHSALSGSYMESCIEKAMGDLASLDAWQLCNLAFVQEAHKLASAIPLPLLDTILQCRIGCFYLWKQAVAANDYSLVATKLGELLKYIREYLAIKGEVLKISNIYDTALRSFDPDISSSAIDGLFIQVGRHLSDNSAAITTSRKKSAKQSRTIFSVAKQEDLLSTLLNKILKCRVTAPVVIGGSVDYALYERDSVLISAVLEEHDPVCGIRRVMSHVGHSLFVAGRDKQKVQQLAGAQRGQVIAEAVAALFSFHISTSKEFASFIQPDMGQLFSGRSKSWSAGDCYDLLSRNICSLNRLECDEAAAMSHIMMRYAIEKELLANNLQAEDLPDIWQEGCKRYFNAVPRNSSESCLQDAHWYQGMFGYFPAQAVGIMLASKLRESVPTLGDDFDVILSWIRDNIVESSTGFSTQDIICNVADSAFKAADYLRYLDNKYMI